MEFRLTYEGPLLSTQRDPVGNQRDPRANHKHDIRQSFHRQLSRLWDVNPALNRSNPIYLLEENDDFGMPQYAMNPNLGLKDWLGDQYNSHGFRFAPLVRESLSLNCELDILMLRPDNPGGVIKSADIDNRLKTLFDALRIPRNLAELNGATPQEGEDPFCCLLEDDSLITRVNVETDVLLEPINGGFNASDARLLIKVRLHPYSSNTANALFA